MTTTDSTISAWLQGRLPDAWTATPARFTIDRDEITIVLTVDPPALGDDASEVDRAEAVAGRVAGFREETRDARIQIAREAEHRFERKVAWGVTIGDHHELFTLVAANVARSRADALAWCVRLVGRNTEAWLSELREAMHEVERLRADGPSA
jgi:hypothetical protein